MNTIEPAGSVTNFGAALYFDPQSDAAIRGVWQQVEDAGLPSKMLSLNYPPHLTMMTCEQANLAELRPRLLDFTARLEPIPLRFHSVATFGGPEGVIYLAPVVNRTLLDLHAALWEIVTPFATGHNGLYAPGTWVPHVTMNVEVPPEQIGAVIDAMLRSDLPREGLLTALFIADFQDGAPGFRELFKERLGNG